MKVARTIPSKGLSFNHQTLCKLIKTRDSLEFWKKLEHDPNNPHLHNRARRKIKRLYQIESLLRKVLYP